MASGLAARRFGRSRRASFTSQPMGGGQRRLACNASICGRRAIRCRVPLRSSRANSGLAEIRELLEVSDRAVGRTERLTWKRGGVIGCRQPVLRERAVKRGLARRIIANRPALRRVPARTGPPRFRDTCSGSLWSSPNDRQRESTHQDQPGDTRDADLQRYRDDARTDSGGRELVRQAGARRHVFPRITAARVARSGPLQRNRSMLARLTKLLSPQLASTSRQFVMFARRSAAGIHAAT